MRKFLTVIIILAAGTVPAAEPAAKELSKDQFNLAASAAKKDDLDKAIRKMADLKDDPPPLSKDLFLPVEKVEVKTAPKKDFTACVAAVKSGKVVFLTIGPNPVEGDYHTDGKGLKQSDGSQVQNGRYKCFLVDNEPKWHPVDSSGNQIVTGVSSGSSSKSVGDDDHTCPNCEKYQNVHNKTNADGSHSHKCQSCGTEWWHGGPLGYPGTRQTSPVKPTTAQTTQRLSFAPQFQFGLTIPGMQLSGCVGSG